MSIVSNSIINADAEARYLSPGELDQIKAFVSGGQRRLRVAQVLSESRERIVKTAGVPAEQWEFSGPAKVAESQEEAVEKILGGQIQAGDVVVVRNVGPVGGPGMPEIPEMAVPGLL